LPQYIEHLYEKRFHKKLSDETRPVEVIDAERRKRKEQIKAKRRSDEGNST
jgi:hypothetical protein